MKKLGIKILVLSIVLVMSKVSMAQDGGQIVIPLSEPSQTGKLRVDIRKGSISVTGVDRKDVLLVYSPRNSEKHKTEKKGELKKISGAAIDLEASEKNNVINVESGSWNKAIDLKIEVPRQFDLHLETYNSGYIAIEGVSGDLVTDNYNGKITAVGISGSLIANTYNGKIQAIFEKVTPDTPMAFSTYNGDVDITFPASVKANLKMKSGGGDIYTDFDMQVSQAKPSAKEEKKSGVYKVYIDDWVRGAINGGGPEMMMKNYNGDIYIRKK